MKNSIKALLIATTLTGGVAGGIAYAISPGGAEGHGPPPMGFGRHHGDSDLRIDRMAETLGLTKEQRDAMRAIVDKARPQTRELRDKLSENRKQLHALMQQGSPKETDVRKLADAQGRATADMIVLRTKVQTEIRGVLTEQQREKLQQLRKSHSRPGPSEQHGNLEGAPDAASAHPDEATDHASVAM